jgi:hypothetical protein
VKLSLKEILDILFFFGAEHSRHFRIAEMDDRAAAGGAPAEVAPPASDAPPPIYKWPPFAADLLDPFAEGESIEGGEVLYSLVVLDATLKSLLSDAPTLLPFLASGELAAVEAARAKLEQAAPLAQFALEKVSDEKALNKLVKQWAQLLRALPEGETLFLPGGWKDGVGKNASVMHVVQRTSGGDAPIVVGGGAAADAAAAAAAAAALDVGGDDGESEDSDEALALALALSMGAAPQAPAPSLCTFATVNPGRDGSDFHRSAARVDEASGTFYLDYETALVLDDVSLERVANPMFLATLLSQRCAEAESHRPEILYHALLPWLAEQSLLEALVSRKEVAAAGALLSAASAADAASAAAPPARGGEWRPQCRAETSSYHCVLEAVRLVLRRAGLSATQLEQVRLHFFCLLSSLLLFAHLFYFFCCSTGTTRAARARD